MDQFRKETQAKQAISSRDEINLLNMIESRIMEVIQIEDECKKKLPKLYHQRLARFMRRRAASHNIKRLPRKFRPPANSSYGTKSRKKLLKYRQRLRFRKHKRILRKHRGHNYKDPNKCLLHNWFAKRFRMISEGELKHVPLHNSTKNQRNLYRQTRYGCAYLSLAHLVPIQLELGCQADSFISTNQLENLNKFTMGTSGFTFCAKSLARGNYETVVHLYKLNTSPREYLCYSLVSLSGCRDREKPLDLKLTLWVPRVNYEEVFEILASISRGCVNEFVIKRINPRDWIRVRLLGPEARDEALKIANNESEHKSASQDTDMRLNSSLGLTIGRYIDEKSTSFTYYNTKPHTVDIVFKSKEGKMLWYKLIKNRAHLVGGYRDLDRLLVSECFQIKPDV